PPSVSELRKSFPHIPNDRVCFLAAGRSMEIVNDYRARMEDWETKIKATCHEIEAEVAKKKDMILSVLPDGEDVRIGASYSYSMGGGDKATFTLSVRREGKVDLFSMGKTVNVPPSPAYNIEERAGGEYGVTPRRDTPEGQKLAALFDAIPLTPGLRDYRELFANYEIKESQIGQMFGVNGVVPQVVDVGGYTVLLYNAAPKDKKRPFCPPGAKPVPAEIYDWLRSDEGDRNMGIAPPPRPAEVERVLASARSSLPQRNKSARKPEI
ncbi:MAG TPA: hypothetical protein VIF12_02975, partial [Micavibrio sp.]